MDHRCRLLPSRARASAGSTGASTLTSSFAALALSLALAGCLPPSTDDFEDAGASGATGGSVGSTGSGGSVAGPSGSGGATTVGTGGATTAGSGGRTGTADAGTNPGSGGSGSGSGGRVGSGGAGSGGRVGSGGSGSGGRMGSGGAGSGGRVGSGGAVGSGGRVGSGGVVGTGGSTAVTSCTTIGASMTVNSTIVVRSGQTYDGQCRRFIAGSSLGDGSSAEGQDPVFDIENNGTLINVVLGGPAADGIHTSGNATLRNITWEDIGEDALTIEGGGTVTLDGGSARNGDDKVFQINAASTFRVSNFRAQNAGKFIRQNGGTTFTMNVFIDRCDISNMSESIVRTDSSTSKVTMTNTRYSRIGDALFLGFASSNITQSGNTQY